MYYNKEGVAMAAPCHLARLDYFRVADAGMRAARPVAAAARAGSATLGVKRQRRVPRPRAWYSRDVQVRVPLGCLAGLFPTHAHRFFRGLTTTIHAQPSATDEDADYDLLSSFRGGGIKQTRKPPVTRDDVSGGETHVR